MIPSLGNIKLAVDAWWDASLAAEVSCGRELRLGLRKCEAAGFLCMDPPHPHLTSGPMRMGIDDGAMHHAIVVVAVVGSSLWRRDAKDRMMKMRGRGSGWEALSNYSRILFCHRCRVGTPDHGSRPAPALPGVACNVFGCHRNRHKRRGTQCGRGGHTLFGARTDCRDVC